MEHFAIAYGLHMDAALTSEAIQMKTVLPGNHTALPRFATLSSAATVVAVIWTLD